MKTIFANKTIVVGDYEFEGFKLFSCENYPWNNHSERNQFFTNLIRKGGEESRILATSTLKRELIEKIHLTISASYIFLYAAIILGIISIITLITIGFFGKILFAVSVLLYFYYSGNKREALKQVAFLDFNVHMLAIEFDEKYVKAINELERANKEYANVFLEEMKKHKEEKKTN